MHKKIIAFDLDDVLCTRDSEIASVEKYKTCKPLSGMIKIANKCYDDGHHIIIYTARGMKIFDGNINDIYANLYDLTKQQLSDWNVKYHELIMGKAHYDLLIDDKAIDSLRVTSIDKIYQRIK